MHCPRCESEIRVNISPNLEYVIFCEVKKCRWVAELGGSLLEDDIEIMIKSADQERYLDGERLRQA